MSRNDPTEILVAVHRDQPDTNAVLVSINGDGKRSHWVARSQIFSYHLIGTSTEGTDQNGVRKRLPLANMNCAGMAGEGSGVHLMARTTFLSMFKLGDKVAIDGDASIRATVIGFAFYPHVEQVQVAWFANGSAQESWIASFRLELVK